MSDICRRLGACAYDVVDGTDAEPCPWWSDCFGASNPLPFALRAADHTVGEQG